MMGPCQSRFQQHLPARPRPPLRHSSTPHPTHHNKTCNLESDAKQGEFLRLAPHPYNWTSQLESVFRLGLDTTGHGWLRIPGPRP